MRVPANAGEEREYSISILTQLKTVAEDLNQLQVDWALIGALAVSVHTEPRSTRDIDIAIALETIKAQDELVQHLIRLGYGNEQLLRHVLLVRKLGVRLEVRGNCEFPLALALLFSSSGIEPEIVAGASRLEMFPGLFVPVASRGHLIAMKVLSQNETDRLRDRVDLQQLLHQASVEDIASAEAGLKLIIERGFDRSKDLLKDLRKFLKTS